MIEARELHRRSRVLYDGKPFMVAAINFIHDEVNIIGVSEPLDYILEAKHLEPIPLSEEWLLKAGFVHDLDESKPFFTMGNLSLEVYKILAFPANWSIRVWIGSNKLHTIQSVHQLQNLVFALTGHELEFKD